MKTFGKTSPTHSLELAKRNASIVFMEQVHGNMLANVEQDVPHSVRGVDTLVTDRPGVQLVIRHADCLPIAIHAGHWKAAIHAGRISTTLKIAQNVVQYIKRHSNDIQDWHIFFGPAICVDCYQVDQATDAHFDLIAENRQQIESEVPASAVAFTISQICTKCQNQQYFSYRGDGKGTPMNYSVI